jgi:hypothetical protein
MRIEICEDNGLLNDGVPSLVMVIVSFTNNQPLRFPYHADKTIQELYQDINALGYKEKVVDELPSNFQEAFDRKTIERVKEVIADTIEREDIVECVKIHDREPGADSDLVIGDEYRIIDIIKQNGLVVRYEVIDDNADVPIRFSVLPDEVKLVRKRRLKTQKVGKARYEIIDKCAECGKENVLVKDDSGLYIGICHKCGAILKEEI